MPNLLVIAHHLVWTNYGAWLPNDPRGSSSHAVREPLIEALGDLHHGRKHIQPAGQIIQQFKSTARPWLRHESIDFNLLQRHQIAQAFGEVIDSEKYTCWACAIMPDHVHLLVRKHRHSAEEMIGHFQNASAAKLREGSTFPVNHPIWGGPGWKVFLHHPVDVQRVQRYIVDNPAGARLSEQHWPFVKPYDNWPLHKGHSPRSPYAKAMRAAGRYP